ncbi:RsfA family transcriptional regulator [Paenibacillus pini]|uniref:Prespore specific transcriptional activator RsfA n=1 Tax=Paenibacillus pini JCM 16418 TaxID=1236976 RepID=W7YZ65_9BACL|nr:RsfA family transcriptional regulator [Paenibacillus pini]GAF09946.1 prespore specific transcriptional activator RsfA [Paenibacillus pini JCM 16418]
MVRQDSWTPEDDLCLSTTVLGFIKNGGTQLTAFEIVGEKTNRTPAACGFRWNSYLRKMYESEIKEAKLNRTLLKSQKKVHSKSTESFSIPSVSSESTISLDVIINSLLQFKEQFEDMRKTIMDLHNKNDELEQKSSKEHNDTTTDDMRSLLEIMKRAEKLGLTNREKPAI